MSQYFQTPIRLICDEEKYLAHPDAHRVNYSYHRLLDNELWIHSHVLLFESTIRPVKIECFDLQGHKAFFKAEGDTGFDLFAAIFYLITRYEEYLPHPNDSYGRFSHTASLAHKEGFLQLPLVNLWLEDFRRLLQERFPDLHLPMPAFRLQLTYDIDIAWSFQNKGFRRNAGALARLFFSGRWKAMAHRIRVIRGRRQDPFDAYEWMDNLHRQAGVKPLYFFLVARLPGRFDRNIEPENPAFQQLIHRLASTYSIGLHPSWASGDQQPLLAREKSWLEKVSGQGITASRQHYLRFELPATYRRLLAIGIYEEYSMGYGTANGFRASVATPFFWYDLKNESKTDLRIYPFCFMDANAYYEEKKTPEEALREMFHYFETVRSVNGTLITIWHNSFLGIDPAFAGWREAYEQFVQKASLG